MSRLTKRQIAEQEEAKEELRKIIPPGSTVYTILHQVSRSGMSRHIGVRCIQNDDNGKPFIRYLDGLVARALGERIAKNGGLVVGGCGMDMGFHIVNCLSYCLHGNKPEQVAEQIAKHGWVEGGRYTKKDHPGYTLSHEWM
jgi:hypothetical protein